MDALILSDFTKPAAGVQVAEKIAVTKERKKIAINSSVKILLTFSIGLIAWFSSKPSLYDQYKVGNSVIAKQLAKSSQEDLKVAAEHLESGNYYEVKQILSKHYIRNLGNISLAKQYAAILIESDSFETSKQVLYPVYNSKNKNDKAEAAYLLGLVFLKEGNKEDSRQWLVKVMSGSIYYRQAQELMVKLDAAD